MKNMADVNSFKKNLKNKKLNIGMLYKNDVFKSSNGFKAIDGEVDLIVTMLKKYDPPKRKIDKNYEHDKIDFNIVYNSNRVEEYVCKMLFTINSEKYIDYQYPLKPSSKDEDVNSNQGYGKIDIMYREGNALRLIELKRSNSEEYIIRAMLECVTYFKQFSLEKFKKDYKDNNVSGINKIIPTVAVPQRMVSQLNKYPCAKELFQKLNKSKSFGLELFLYTYDDSKNINVTNKNKKYCLKIENPCEEFPFENVTNEYL